MPIRQRNLDLETDGMKRSVSVRLGAISGGETQLIFAAPVPCRVDSIDIYSGDQVPLASTTASSTLITIKVQRASDSATVGERGTSATTTTTNTINANVRYRIIPSANNSLSVGTALRVQISGSGILSGVLCVTNYTPLNHRETR